VVWIPALRTDEQVVPLGLDNFCLQYLEFKPLPAPITLRDRVFA